MEATKFCKKCGKIKPKSEFSNNKSAKDGLQSWCRDCFKEISKRYKVTKPKEVIAKVFKKCSSCGEIKTIEEFSKNRSRKDGLSHNCKACEKEYKKQYKAKSIEKEATKIVKQTFDNICDNADNIRKNRIKKEDAPKKQLSIVEKIEQNNIKLKMIDGQVYADANSMTDSTTLDNWRRSENTKRYINAINRTVKSTERIITKKGGAKGGETWIHEKLILSLARYISVEFEIWCDNKIAEFISGNSEKPKLPVSYKEALIELLATVEEKEKLQLENNVMQPKALFYDNVANSKDTMDMGEVAKTLNRGIGRNKLFKFLKEKKILDRYKRPYQEFVDRGYFKTIEVPYKQHNKESDIYIKTVVFQKGVEYIIKLLDQKNIAE